MKFLHQKIRCLLNMCQYDNSFLKKFHVVPYHPKYAANGMGITGWAKNEYDGSVEMEAQGTEEAINQMLVMINRSDYIVIDSIESKKALPFMPLPPTPPSFSTSSVR